MASSFGGVLSKLMVMAITTEHCFFNTSSKSLDHVHQFQMKNEKTPPPKKKHWFGYSFRDQCKFHSQRKGT